MEIEFRDVIFSYKTPGSSPKPAIRNIALKLSQNESVAIIGRSGSGKTTLMQHLTGLLKPDAGQVFVNGVNLRDKSVQTLDIRRRIGLVFQFPETQLFGETVFEDVAFGPRNLGYAQEEVEKSVRNALKLMGLELATLTGRPPTYLSDGEKRRVAIAGILAMQPSCLVLDEPTAGLDYPGRILIKRFLTEYHRAGNTLVLISHDLELVMALCKRLIVLDRGKIVWDGAADRAFRDSSAFARWGIVLPRARKLASHLAQLGLLGSDNMWTIEAIKEGLQSRHNSVLK